MSDISQQLRDLYATYPVCVEAAAEIDRLRSQLNKARGLLRYALADYGHPNFTDRHGMADRIRAALTEEK